MSPLLDGGYAPLSLAEPAAQTLIRPSPDGSPSGAARAMSRAAAARNVSKGLACSGTRKSGMRRWFPRFRAVLLDDDRQVAAVSSLARAEEIAGLLRVILRAEWRADVEEVLRSDDAELVDQVAALLERIDPAKRIRLHGTGIRWW